MQYKNHKKLIIYCVSVTIGLLIIGSQLLYENKTSQTIETVLDVGQTNGSIPKQDNINLNGSDVQGELNILINDQSSAVQENQDTQNMSISQENTATPDATHTKPMQRQPGESKEQHIKRILSKIKEPSDEEMRLRDAPHDAAKKQDWQQFLSNVDELNQAQEFGEIHLASNLLTAIKYDAPDWVFEKLLARGATFEFVHLHALILKNNLVRIQDLARLGLNIHSTSPNGHNGLYSAMTTVEAYALFDYLLNMNLSTDNIIDGQDYLELSQHEPVHRQYH